LRELKKEKTLTNIIAKSFFCKGLVVPPPPPPLTVPTDQAGRYSITHFVAAFLFISNCLCAKFELYSREFVLGCDAVNRRQFGT
jgi:hypothetical protein